MTAWKPERLLFWLMIVGPLHMTEQLVFGIEELELFKGPFNSYYAKLEPIGADRATVILITLAVTFFTLLCYCMLAGGRMRLAALAFFGLLGAGEAHHVIQAVANRGYDSGVVTCIPYCALGTAMVVTVSRELRKLAATGTS